MHFRRYYIVYFINFLEKNRFGHSKIETTLKFYSQASLHEDQKLVTKFDETFRNQLGFSLKDLYDICYNKYPHTKDLFDFVEYLTGKIVDGTNYSVEFERCQNYLLELFPVFSSIHQIDNNMNDKDIEKMLTGFEKDYRKIRIDPMPQPYIK